MYFFSRFGLPGLPSSTIHRHHPRPGSVPSPRVPFPATPNNAAGIVCGPADAYQVYANDLKTPERATMTAAGRAQPHETISIGTGPEAVPSSATTDAHVFTSAFALPGAHGPSYLVSREEALKGLANRFVHSTTYVYLYATMALLSLLTVVISLMTKCPGPAFYLLELVVNVVLMAEVGVRFIAFGKHFWKSTYNIVDLCLVALCGLTLVVLFFGHGCSPYAQRTGRREELLDSILLIVRNAIQCTRLLSVVRRSRYNVTSRVAAIDLSEAREYDLDLDLEEESMLARQRMRDGGDHTRTNTGWRPEGAGAHTHYQDTIVAVDEGEL